MARVGVPSARTEHVTGRSRPQAVDRRAPLG
jgi:hypothetical protein